MRHPVIFPCIIRISPAPVSLTVSQYVKDLGTGGFGRVLLCRNSKLQRDVAIKVLTHQSERASRQFYSEAKNLALFNNHRNIVQIHGFFETGGWKLIEMEYVRDGNLKQRLLDGPRFTHAECMQCFLQLISTVKYLHKLHMLHCDIKPENVLLGRDPHDNSVVFKLADFGLSRDESAAMSTSTMTSSIIFMGTRLYVACPSRCESHVTVCAGTCRPSASSVPPPHSPAMCGL
jgi:serine/threonine protein kinase